MARTYETTDGVYVFDDPQGYLKYEMTKKNAEQVLSNTNPIVRFAELDGCDPEYLRGVTEMQDRIIQTTMKQLEDIVARYKGTPK